MLPLRAQTLLPLVGVSLLAAIAQTHILAALPSKQTVTSSTAYNESSMLKNLGAATRALLRHLDEASQAAGWRPANNSVHNCSLVCQELCGAGRGGPECAAYCAKNASMDFKRHRRPLAEWTACYLYINRQATDMLQTTAGGCKCNAGAAKLTRHCENNCQLAKAALSGQHGAKLEHKMVGLQRSTAPGNSGGNKNATPVASNVASTEAPSTPNWSELCKWLCKTGDGGSLCNCDLSPFLN